MKWIYGLTGAGRREGREEAFWFISVFFIILCRLASFTSVTAFFLLCHSILFFASTQIFIFYISFLSLDSKIQNAIGDCAHRTTTLPAKLIKLRSGLD